MKEKLDDLLKEQKEIEVRKQVLTSSLADAQEQIESERKVRGKSGGAKGTVRRA